MNHIGSIIKTYRRKNCMSRCELSADICTEKYLYMIEKGDRNPSAGILRALGIRLGADLFGYFEYLGCKNPIAVREAITQFNTYRAIPDFTELKLFSDMFKPLPDFQGLPWKYEISVNDISYMVFVERRFNEGVEAIKSELENMDARYDEESVIIMLYNLLSICYLNLKDVALAEEAIKNNEKRLWNKDTLPNYNMSFISSKINRMHLYQIGGNYDRAIEIGLWINEYRLKYHPFERANLTYFSLAHAYYIKGSVKEALYWFEKCLLSLLLLPSRDAVTHISSYRHFNDMFNHPDIAHCVKERIMLLYDLK